MPYYMKRFWKNNQGSPISKMLVIGTFFIAYLLNVLDLQTSACNTYLNNLLRSECVPPPKKKIKFTC